MKRRSQKVQIFWDGGVENYCWVFRGVVAPHNLIWARSTLPTSLCSQMVMGTEKLSTRRILPNKDVSIESYFYSRVKNGQHHVPIG
jgi:hypothetical protein